MSLPQKYYQEYRAWCSAKVRCYNPKSIEYKIYGARGISVCPEWLNNFKKFLEDLGPRPKGYSLDRIDNDKGYSKDNCRWIPRADQSRNTRSNKLSWDKANHIREKFMNGSSFRQLANEMDLAFQTISQVVYNETWRDESYISPPKKQPNKNRKHFSSLKKKGPMSEDTYFDNFWKHINKTENCWLWMGAKSEFGHGRYRHGAAHRISYELHKGKIPDGMCVCHKCDNPSCVNPEHLFIGTKKDNNNDCQRKGRRVANQRLKPEEIKEIIEAKRKIPSKLVAEKFNIEPQYVRAIWCYGYGKAAQKKAKYKIKPQEEISCAR